MDANVDAPAAWTTVDVRIGRMGVVVEHASDPHHHGECVEVFCMGYRQPIYLGRILLAIEFSRWLGESLRPTKRGGTEIRYRRWHSRRSCTSVTGRGC